MSRMKTAFCIREKRALSDKDSPRTVRKMQNLRQQELSLKLHIYVCMIVNKNPSKIKNFQS